jgi:threonine dehydratase
MTALEPIPLAEIRAARERIESFVLRTPLVRLNVDDAPAEIHLKLENLQPIGSFKLRGAGNAMAAVDESELAHGVYTASAGNMAQGVAWCARRAGIACSVVVPDHAPRAKLDAIERLGASVVPVPFERWWQVLVERSYPGLKGRFVHPVSERDVIAGNATIGLEILEDLSDVDAILVPYGGGGLSSGIASAVRAMKSRARVLACEVETGAPLAASLAAHEPREVDHRPSFVDGISSRRLLAEMWPLVSKLLDGSIVVSIDEVASAVRTLATRNRVIAEGAGATPVAAALSGRACAKKIVCVVSGGNIDASKLRAILDGATP